MQFLLSVIEPDGPMPEPEVMARIVHDVDIVDADIRASGAWVFAGGLHFPSASTVVRPTENGVLVTDGPYTEGKEHLGGFSIIDVPDLDAALEWARRLALATTLPIEVRPFRDGPPA